MSEFGYTVNMRAGERVAVTVVTNSGLDWPWGLDGPALAFHVDRAGKRREWLCARWSVRIPVWLGRRLRGGHR